MKRHRKKLWIGVAVLLLGVGLVMGPGTAVAAGTWQAFDELECTGDPPECVPTGNVICLPYCGVGCCIINPG
jgi:hypothetical protein